MKSEILSLLTEKPIGGIELLDPKDSLTKWAVQYEKEFGELPSPQLFIDEFFPGESTQPPAPWSYYKEKLEQDKLVRDLQPAFDTFSSLYIESPYKASAKLVEQVLALEKQQHSTQDAVILNEWEGRWERFNNPTNTKRLLTGVAPFDSLTGGISGEDYFVISARTGRGKSYLGHYILAHMAANGNDVGIYSGEMPVDEVGARIDSILSHVSNWNLYRGKLTDPEPVKTAWSEVPGKIPIIATAQLKRFARPSDIKKFVNTYNLKCVLLDQASLMVPDGPHITNEVQRWYELSRQLRILNLSLGIPFIIINQLNRGAEGQEATTANLSGGDAFGNDSTIALALSRPSSDVLKINVMKVRGVGVPESPWEFTWDVDRGYITYQQSKLDSIKSKVATAKVKDSEKNNDDEEVV